MALHHRIRASTHSPRTASRRRTRASLPARVAHMAIPLNDGSGSRFQTACMCYDGHVPMGIPTFTLRIAGFLVLMFVSLHGQSTSEMKVFDRDGVKFEYPAAWTFQDRSTPETQYLLLGKDDSVLIVALISPRKPVQSFEELEQTESDTRVAFLQPIEALIREPGASPFKTDTCLDLNGRKVAGPRSIGTYKSQRVALEIYPTALGQRSIALVFIWALAKEEENNSHWRNLIRSLSVSGSNRDVGSLLLPNGGLLNGKALKLARPRYPMGAVGPRIGTVTVEITIDEKGDVIEAKAVTGVGAFRTEAVTAAKKSKFPPTLVCGQPIRITGTIFYNFSP